VKPSKECTMTYLNFMKTEKPDTNRRIAESGTYVKDEDADLSMTPYVPS
jgi:hypothetical protein